VIVDARFFNRLDALSVSQPTVLKHRKHLIAIIIFLNMPSRRGHKAMMLSDVCLFSVAYIGPKSRTERPRKTKIGTEVTHVTRD